MNDLVHKETTQRVVDAKHAALPIVGQWYWIDWNDGEGLACLTHLGSNFAEFQTVYGGKTRIHVDNFDKKCRYEPDARAVIDREVQKHQTETNRLLQEVRDVTARLSVQTPGTLPSAAASSSTETSALVAHSDPKAMERYKKDLIKAQKETLPKLFEQIKKSCEQMSTWMKADLVPLEAQTEMLGGSIEAIKHRVFNVELYAGLVEQVEEIKKGKPASIDEPIRLMQRRLYMDEECLAHYETGGMEFENIREFDRWLASPEHFKRVLPFPRCVVAFRVRRETKERDVNLNIWIRLQLEDADKLTFLYLRNGEQLFRLSTEIQFNEKLFPDMENQALDTVMWAKVEKWYDHKVEALRTDDAYQGMQENLKKLRIETEEKLKELSKKQSKKKDPTKEEKEEGYKIDHEKWLTNNKLAAAEREAEGYVAFSSETVYYDEIRKHIGRQIDHHNRLVLILQGLLDRSPVFAPHPAWRIWDDANFTAAIRLVYDDTRALAPAVLPDFEEYRAKLNSSIETGSHTVGQQDVWEHVQAEKENDRRDNSYAWRNDRYRHVTRFKPDGNPGPGNIAQVANVRQPHTKEATSKPAKTVTYEWQRSRLREKHRYWESDANSPIDTSFTTPITNVLNIDAYRPGDFKIFFNDPRTRAEYLQWAPLLLAAEEWHAERAILAADKRTKKTKKGDR